MAVAALDDVRDVELPTGAAFATAGRGVSSLWKWHGLYSFCAKCSALQKPFQTAERSITLFDGRIVEEIVIANSVSV